MRRASIVAVLAALAALCGWLTGVMTSAGRGAGVGGNEAVAVAEGFTTGAALSAGLVWLGWVWLWAVHQIWEEHYCNRLLRTAPRCLNCGYPAVSLGEAICPECGKVWNDRPAWSIMPASGSLIGGCAAAWFVAALARSMW